VGSGLARWLYEANAHVTGVSRAARKRLGLSAKLRILPYRGYGTPDRVVVKARVVEDRGVLDPSVRRGLLGAAAASVARFRTAEVARARVRVHFGDDVHEGVTDDEGFLDLAVTPPLWAGPGWHRVGIEVASPEVGDAVRADVLLVGPSAKHAIITDIDDTIILTGVRNLARRAWSLFMADAAGRRVFEGTSALYRGLAAGGSGGEPGMECPVVYVSSSPWNLYDHLEHFLDENGLPRGPILLRDWGLTRDGFAPDGKHHHKLEKIRDVLDTLPHLPFVLVGDSGQHDAEHYLTVAREHPGRVLTVFIREVTNDAARRDELFALAADFESAGTELVVADTSLALAREAAARGLVAARFLDEIAREPSSDA
jgi:phosphatidate phosphatase APP1